MSNLVFLLVFIVVSVLLAMYMNYQSKKNLLDVIKNHPVHLESYAIQNAIEPKLKGMTTILDLITQRLTGLNNLVHSQTDSVFQALTTLSNNTEQIMNSVNTTQEAVIEHLIAMPKLDVSMFMGETNISFLTKEDLVSGAFVTHIAQGHGMITKVNKKTFIVEFEDTVETFNIDELPNVTFIMGLYLFSPVKTKEILLSDTWFVAGKEQTPIAGNGEVQTKRFEVAYVEAPSKDEVSGADVFDRE